MILCRAEPKTSFRSLLNRDSKIYNRSWAAQVLFHDFQGLYPDESKRRDVIIRLRGMCYERQDEMIREAEALGFDANEIDDKTEKAARADSRNGSTRITGGVGAVSGRELVRRSTEEEIQRLERKQRLLQMTREVQRQEAALSQNSEFQGAKESSGSALTGLGGTCQKQTTGIDHQMLSMMKQQLPAGLFQPVNTSFPGAQGGTASNSSEGASVAETIVQALASMNMRTSGGTQAESQDAGKGKKAETAKGEAAGEEKAKNLPRKAERLRQHRRKQPRRRLPRRRRPRGPRKKQR